MAATRASGTNAVRYGTMRENVLGLTVVLADGRIVRTARRARKSSAGYDLTRLFVGSEGTLGIITEVTVRLAGVPETIAAAVCSFDSLAGAVNTVIRTIQLGVPIARVELLDDVQMDAVNRYSGLSHPVQDTLFLEFHGSESSVREDAALVQQIASELGGGAFAWAVGHEERGQLWAARHNAAYANKALRPGCGMWATDVCVPISRLAECILETKRDLRESFLVAPLIGHVGDGNFHLGFLVRRDDPREVAEAERLHDRLVLRALAMDGTCTGEHGVGTGKLRFLAAEHGEALEVMRTIKQALDPLGIMNPGKVLPP
jgi:D-lactate dehydrogenase (cytochrome)